MTFSRLPLFYLRIEVTGIAIEIKQEYKTFTVEEVFEALAKNGLEHIREEWISADNEKVVGGCVLGQAAYNLKTPAFEEQYDLQDEEIIGSVGDLYDELNVFAAKDSRWYNDATKEAMGNDEAGIAEVIVYWNDKRAKNDKGQYLRPKGNSWGYVYELETYAEVVQMAREVMEPYFTHTVKLPHYDY